MNFEYRRYSWKDNKLFYEGKDTGMSIVPMYKISFDDKIASLDCYNLTRAKDNAQKYYVNKRNAELRTQLEGAT